MNKLKLQLATGAVATALLLGFAGPANALAIQFSYNGGAFFEVVDGDANDSTPGFFGHVGFVGAVGPFMLGGSSSLSSNVFDVDFASLGTNLHALTFQAGPGEHELVMMASDTDFTEPTAGAAWSVLNDFSLTSVADSIEWAVYIDFSNTLFGTGTGTLIALGNATSVLDDVLTQLALAASETQTPFSITHVLTATHTGDAFQESNAVINTTVTPEPAALALLGIGLLGAGAMRRRKTA